MPCWHVHTCLRMTIHFRSIVPAPGVHVHKTTHLQVYPYQAQVLTHYSPLQISTYDLVYMYMYVYTLIVSTAGVHNIHVTPIPVRNNGACSTGSVSHNKELCFSKKFNGTKSTSYSSSLHCALHRRHHHCSSA